MPAVTVSSMAGDDSLVATADQGRLYIPRIFHVYSQVSTRGTRGRRSLVSCLQRQPAGMIQAGESLMRCATAFRAADVDQHGHPYSREEAPSHPIPGMG